MKGGVAIAISAASILGAAAVAARWNGGKYSFRDKSVLITGGSRGLGLVLARYFAREGAHLALVSRDKERLAAAQTELAAMGGSVIIIQADAGVRDQAQEAVETCVKAHGTIDVLVNDAGVMEVGPFEHMGLEDFNAAMAVHAWGPLYFSVAAVPYMMRQNCGRIVNISSIGGKLAVPHMAPYVMSKFALSGLSEAMCTELRRHGILVTSVYPGLMRTGSHVNASFRGDPKGEFLWFSVLAGNPLLSIKAEKAARQIIGACRRGQPQLVITAPARIAVAMNALFPNLMSRVMAVTDRLLPHPERATPSRTGWESSSARSPSILTRLADKEISRNHEHRAA